MAKTDLGCEFLQEKGHISGVCALHPLLRVGEWRLDLHSQAEERAVGGGEQLYHWLSGLRY